MTSSPPKEHNFDSIPHVHHLDEFFHRKYEEDPATHTMREVATAEQVLAELERNADKHIHMPSPSYWPIVLATGLPIIALGLIYSIPVAIAGGLVVLYAIYGWALEPSVAPESDFDPASGNGASGNGHAVGASHG
jgi:cytochrome c oxidase subunit 1